MDLLEGVDPELRIALEPWLPTFPQPGAHAAETIAGMRAFGAALVQPFLAEPPVRQERIPGLRGEPEATVYVINADPAVIRPAILHIHGGGYVAGSAVSNVPTLQTQAKALDCVVVTVEYRLAPETPFPGALHDNHAALLWLHREAAALGVAPDRIAVQGESAGGGHAAMLALADRDSGARRIRFLSLVFPMLDDRTGATAPAAAQVGRILWTRELNVIGWSALLGAPAGGASAPPGAVPARASDLSGLPPTFIAVGDLDLFVEEDVAFALRLIQAGVRTELMVLPGAIHAFDMIAPDAGVSRRFRSAHLNALARALGRPELH